MNVKRRQDSGEINGYKGEVTDGEWVERRSDGQMDGWTDGKWVEGRSDGWMHAWREGGADGEEWVEEGAMERLEVGLDVLLVSCLPDGTDLPTTDVLHSLEDHYLLKKSIG